MGVHMDLDFNLLETGSLAFSIILTAFTLQVRFSYGLKCIISKIMLDILLVAT